MSITVTGSGVGGITIETDPTAVKLAGSTMSGTLYLPTLRNLLNQNLSIVAYNDTGAGTTYTHNFNPFTGSFDLASNGGGLKFPDGTTLVTAPPNDARNLSYRVYNGRDIETAGVSGSGGGGGNAAGYYVGCNGGGAGVSFRHLNSTSNAPQSQGQQKGKIDWSKSVRVKCRAVLDAAIDSTATVRFSFGKIASQFSTTTPVDFPSGTVKGIGFKFVGTGAVQLMVSNGTTSTVSTNGTFVPTAAQSFDVEIISDGTGNVNLYINGSTTSSASVNTGPTGLSIGTTATSIGSEYQVTSATATANQIFFGHIHTQIDI